MYFDVTHWALPAEVIPSKLSFFLPIISPKLLGENRTIELYIRYHNNTPGVK